MLLSKNKEGEIPLYRAIKLGSPDSVQKILDATKSISHELLEKLLTSRDNIDYGNTPLHMALSRRLPETKITKIILNAAKSMMR